MVQSCSRSLVYHIVHLSELQPSPIVGSTADWEYLQRAVESLQEVLTGTLKSRTIISDNYCVVLPLLSTPSGYWGACCWLVAAEMKEVLTPYQLNRLKDHQYRSEGISLVEHYVLRHFWNWLVERVPLWVAPNLITFTGFCFTVGTALLMVLQDLNAEGKVCVCLLDGFYHIWNFSFSKLSCILYTHILASFPSLLCL